MRASHTPIYSFVPFVRMMLSASRRATQAMLVSLESCQHALIWNLNELGFKWASECSRKELHRCKEKRGCWNCYKRSWISRVGVHKSAITWYAGCEEPSTLRLKLCNLLKRRQMSWKGAFITVLHDDVPLKGWDAVLCKAKTRQAEAHRTAQMFRQCKHGMRSGFIYCLTFLPSCILSSLPQHDFEHTHTHTHTHTHIHIHTH